MADLRKTWQLDEDGHEFVLYLTARERNALKEAMRKAVNDATLTNHTAQLCAILTSLA